MAMSSSDEDEIVQEFGVDEEKIDNEEYEEEEKVEEVSDVPTPVPGSIYNTTDGTVTDVIRRLSSGGKTLGGSIAGKPHLFSPPPTNDSAPQDSFSRSRSISDTLANEMLETQRRSIRERTEGPNDGGLEIRAEEERIFSPVSRKSVQWGLRSSQLRHSIRSPPPDDDMIQDVMGQSLASPSSSSVKLASGIRTSNRSSTVSVQDDRTANDMIDSSSVYQQFEQRLSQMKNTLHNKYSPDNRTPHELHKLNSRLASMIAEIPQEYNSQHQHALTNKNDDELIFNGQDSDNSRFTSSISYNRNSEYFRPNAMAHSPSELLSQTKPIRIRSPRRSSQGFQSGFETASSISSTSSTEAEVLIPQSLEQFRTLDNHISELETYISDLSTQHKSLNPSIKSDNYQRSFPRSLHNSISNKSSYEHSGTRDTQSQLTTDHSFHDYVPHSEQEARIITSDQSIQSKISVPLLYTDPSQIPSMEQRSNYQSKTSFDQSLPRCGKEQVVCYVTSGDQELRNRTSCCPPPQSQIMCCCKQVNPQSCCEAMLPPQVLVALICIMVLLIGWIMFCFFCYDINILLQSKNHRKFNSNTNGNNKPMVKKTTSGDIDKKTRPMKKPEIQPTQCKFGHSKEGLKDPKASLCSSRLKWLAYTLHDCSEHD